jgi:Na+/H+ antiporter NhaD/arsenite permease-like protein
LPRLRKLFLDRFLLIGAAVLAIAAVASGRVTLREAPSLLDLRLLVLFAVLTVAVALGRASRLFEEVVNRVARRVHTGRGLALAMVAVTGVLAMLLTNDVALFLVLPFTLLFARFAEIDIAMVVVLEISSANLLGSLTPIGNPQNLFLFARGGFSPGSFVLAQLPVVLCSAFLLAAAAWRLLPGTSFPRVAPARVPVDRMRSIAFAAILGAEIANIFGWLPQAVPLAFAAVGAVLLGRRLRDADFSLVFVFALLFVGVAGLERSHVYASVDPVRIFGNHAFALTLSGALLSQIVSNVPAAMLLAPAAATTPGFVGLMHGVTVGSCGTPMASIANLIGAQLYLRSGAPAGRFWRLFSAVSWCLLGLLLAFTLGWARLALR